MYRGHTTAVVIPAFNEERAIAAAVRSVPGFIDVIIVVDDASWDRTRSIVKWELEEELARRVDLIRHGGNRGVGAAIVSGYRRAMAQGIDLVAVMAGDGQMDPADLPALLDPLVDGDADYTKGNRFAHRELVREMPPTRIVGNLALSWATRVTSGYRTVFDSQCGYTAITRSALERVSLDRVFTRYGYPNDLLARLHTISARVKDVPVRPIYGPEWKSGIRLRTVVYPIAFVLTRSWIERQLREARPGVRSQLRN